MEYSWKKIGARIKDERRLLSLTQEKLLEEIEFSGSSRQLVGRWEKGASCPAIEELLKLCEIFNCELGYLLCEYDCKNREATDIQAVTGLSEKAIKKLSKIKDFDAIRETLFTLNAILEHEDFEEFIKISHSYRLEVYKDFTMEDEERFSKIFYCRPSDLKTYLKSASMKTIESFLMNIIEGRSNHPKSPNPKRLF